MNLYLNEERLQSYLDTVQEEIELIGKIRDEIRALEVQDDPSHLFREQEQELWKLSGKLQASFCARESTMQEILDRFDVLTRETQAILGDISADVHKLHVE